MLQSLNNRALDAITRKAREEWTRFAQAINEGDLEPEDAAQVAGMFGIAFAELGLDLLAARWLDDDGKPLVDAAKVRATVLGVAKETRDQLGDLQVDEDLPPEPDAA